MASTNELESNRNSVSAVLKGILIGSVCGFASWGILLGLIYVFRFQIDCSPHEIDGQCGMGLWAARIFSVPVAVGFAVITGVFFGGRAKRQLIKKEQC
jgi:hypothetical protein